MIETAQSVIVQMRYGVSWSGTYPGVGGLGRSVEFILVLLLRCVMDLLTKLIDWTERYKSLLVWLVTQVSQSVVCVPPATD
jgi:hypothetical protein